MAVNRSVVTSKQESVNRRILLRNATAVPFKVRGGGGEAVPVDRRSA